jgi:hypothetical protein
MEPASGGMCARFSFFIREKTQGWLLDTIIPIIGVVTGFVGSVFSTNIIGAFPFDPNEWFIRPTFSNLWNMASLFWALLFVFSGFLTKQQIRNHKQRKIDRDSVSQQIASLQRVLGTMPPVDFMDALSKTFQESDNFITDQKAIAESDSEITSQEERVDVERAKDRRNQARYILSSMVALASQWDNTLISGTHGATYRANIMLFRSKEYIANLNVFAAHKLLTAAKFINCENTQDAFEALDGLLEVDCMMTYCAPTLLADKRKIQPTEDENKQNVKVIPNDTEIKPFALGVTFPQHGVEKNLPNLLGAPEAFATEAPSVISDTQTMVKDCIATGCFSVPEIESIGKYYNRDMKGRSIISWPIKDAIGTPIAVINIYRDKKDISLDEKRAKRLVGILAPFTLMFRDILADIKE